MFKHGKNIKTVLICAIQSCLPHLADKLPYLELFLVTTDTISKSFRNHT